MLEKQLRDLYKSRGYDDSAADLAVADAREMDSYLKIYGVSVETASPGQIEKYIAALFESGKINLPLLLALARYCHVANNHGAYIYFTRILGGIGVIESIKNRMLAYAGEEAVEKVFSGLLEIPLGTAPGDMPAFTARFMDRLKASIEPSLYKKILAGNNHGLPESAMQEEKRLYEESSSLDEYLAGRHARNVAELQEYCNIGKIWYEQEITQEVVDYVSSNQEILSAVRDGGKLYMTKIPYDGINFLKSTDPVLKSYYACHCPFARERILDESRENIDSDWCYCSAGFEKFPFEVILGTELGVELLQSALRGDPVCRFAVMLPPGIK
ncbi:MAG: hypothetical protein JXB33_10020 [Clostridia bacterium]|nr:hypothetical protein [Clostridia bacterium]